MISLSVSMTVGLVSSSTGRRLSGAANVYQRISPRRTGSLPPCALPGSALLVVAELVGTHWNGTIQSGVTRRIARSAQDELCEPNLLVVRQLRDER
jgi:hypothetical protein